MVTPTFNLAFPPLRPLFRRFHRMVYPCQRQAALEAETLKREHAEDEMLSARYT